MKRKMRKTFTGNYGFTLVELLVVISIITLLTSILVPVMSRAKAQAYRIVCQSQFRQWGFAFEVYSMANEGFYPHIDGRDRTSSNPQTPADIADYYFGWIDVLPPLMGEKPWREHEYWHRPGVGTIFQCPSARLGPDKSYKYRPRRTGYFSYAMNSCLELDENCWSPYGCTDNNWHMSSFLNITSIKTPSRLILLFDQLLDPEKGYGGEKYNATAGKYCGSYPKAFAARHFKKRGKLGGSILFCDYHVEWAESVWKPDWPEDLEVPPRNDFNWYPYP